MSLYLLVIPACLFPALAIPRPTEVCVRGARAKRGDPRTEPRRLSGVSSRPVKVGAAGTRLALERRDWTRHWTSPKELIEDPASSDWLDPSAHKSKSLSLSTVWTSRFPAEKFFLRLRVIGRPPLSLYYGRRHGYHRGSAIRAVFSQRGQIGLTHRRSCAFDGRAVACLSYSPFRWLSTHLPSRDAAHDALHLIGAFF